MRTVLQQLADRLGQHDAAVCGDAPRWLIDLVRQTITQFLDEHPGTLSAEEVRPFLLGGIRYVSDSGVVERDRLLEALGQALCSQNNASLDVPPPATQ